MTIPHEVLNCPNFGYPRGTEGRNGYSVEGVCLHITGSDNWEESTKDYLMRYGTNASYNYVIRENGHVIQLVHPDNAAYSHGGVTEPTWPLLKEGVNPNLYTASIARTGSGRTWTWPQWRATWKLLLELSDTYGFPLKEPYVFGHFHITTNRWYCPGVDFWESISNKLGVLTLGISERPVKHKVFAGSFTNLDYANDREHDIAKLSPVIEPKIVEVMIKGKQYYRVFVDEFYEELQAEKALEWLNNNGYNGFITEKVETEEAEKEPTRDFIDVVIEFLEKLIKWLKKQ